MACLILCSVLFFIFIRSVYSSFLYTYQFKRSRDIVCGFIGTKKGGIGISEPCLLQVVVYTSSERWFYTLGKPSAPGLPQRDTVVSGSVNITAADGWPSTCVFYEEGWSLKHISRPLPHLLFHRPFLEDVELRFCSGSHFRKLTFVSKVVIVVPVLFPPQLPFKQRPHVLRKLRILSAGQSGV